MGFIDDMRAEGHAVESTCRVLREQGCPVAARTYRAWRRGCRPAARTISDEVVKFLCKRLLILCWGPGSSALNGVPVLAAVKPGR